MSDKEFAPAQRPPAASAADHDHGRAPLDRVALAVLLFSTFIVLFALVAWMRWPQLHDAPLLNYIGWRLNEGDRPYVDTFDMNFPVTYWFHQLVMAIPGNLDFTWRLIDGFYLVAMSLLIARIMRPAGGIAAWSAVLCFFLSYLSLGPYGTGQRDALMLVLQMGGLCCIIAAVTASRRGWLAMFLAGALLATACGIKPFGALQLAGQALVAVAVSRQQGASWKSALGLLGALVGGATVIGVGILAALLWLGVLDAFVELNTEYLLPIYSQSKSWKDVLLACMEGPAIYYIALLIALTRLHQLARTNTVAWWLVLAAATASLLQFLLQKAGWTYHLLPFLVFAGMAISWHLGTALRAREPLVRAQGLAILLILLLFPSGMLAWNTARELVLGRPYHAAKVQRVAALTDFLGPRLRPGDTVQVLDTTEGGIDALLRLRVAQPTRFIYDFQILGHDPTLPYIQQLRQEYLADIQAAPPRFIVMFRVGYLVDGYERIERFPELARWIESNYQLVEESDDYRIWQRRETESPSSG